MSLDVFRSITILFIVLVNNAGGSVSYRELQHSRGNGWTLTDCVFPSFVWIVGVAITLSLGKRLKFGESPGHLLPKIFRQTVTLYVLRLNLPITVRRNRLFLIGACLLIACLLWNIWLPINKKLWTDSFARFMAGLDFLFLAALIWVVDECHLNRYVKPFVITGMNAIVVYVASEFLSEFLDATSLHEAIYNKLFVPVASPVNASLLWALAFTALMYSISYVMYRRGWFVRI